MDGEAARLGGHALDAARLRDDGLRPGRQARGNRGRFSAFLLRGKRQVHDIGRHFGDGLRVQRQHARRRFSGATVRRGNDGGGAQQGGGKPLFHVVLPFKRDGYQT
ncbi:hypothetical protein D3C72_1962780 [compost metagenome]